MSRKDPQVNMRFPEDLLSILSEKAKENHRSRTAEVIFRLRQSVESDEQCKQATA